MLLLTPVSWFCRLLLLLLLLLAAIGCDKNVRIATRLPGDGFARDRSGVHVNEAGTLLEYIQYSF